MNIKKIVAILLCAYITTSDAKICVSSQPTRVRSCHTRRTPRVACRDYCYRRPAPFYYYGLDFPGYYDPFWYGWPGYYEWGYPYYGRGGVGFNFAVGVN